MAGRARIEVDERGRVRRKEMGEGEERREHSSMRRIDYKF